MRAVGVAICLVIGLAQPAVADVIIPGPPLVPIKIDKSQKAAMARSARAAVTNIFDFSLNERPEYLNETYRAAGKRDIARVTEVVTVSVVGNRAFVLAVTDNWMGPQVIGPVHTYFQCRFDDHGQVEAIEIL